MKTYYDMEQRKDEEEFKKDTEHGELYRHLKTSSYNIQSLNTLIEKERKVIDEAKKEFPKYEAETSEIDAASKAILSHAKFIKKVYEWKEKYFGDDKP